MALPISASDLISPLLLVKAILAALAVFIFLYYRHYWDRAKHRLPIHYFFTKWRAVRHAFFLGIAAIGFALGFSIELFGVPLGMSANLARIVSSIFEAGSLFSMLYVFFSLALEDVPHFQRIADSSAQTVAPHHAPQARPAIFQKPQAMQKPLRKPAKKKGKKNK
jgi:hypothetical protein